MTRTYHGELECKTCGDYDAMHVDDGKSRACTLCYCKEFIPPETPEYRVEQDGKITYL